MSSILKINNLREKVRVSSTYIAVAVMALAGVAPVLLQSQAEAATLTSRKVTITTSQPDATGVGYTFAFTTITTAAIQSVTFQFCSTPLGTCTLPGGASAADKIDVSHVTAAYGSISGWTNATAFTEYTGADAGGCTESDGGSGVATQWCATRTQAANESAGAGRTFEITGISNPTIPTGNNTPIYVRVVTYSDTAFATAVDSGTVAAAVVNQLTVTGRVQERLVFCVYALDDADGSSATVGSLGTHLPTNCAAASATESSNVDIGIIDNLGVARSPVDNNPPTFLGNDRFGAAMVNTNASSGISITYYATAATTGTNELRAFRVAGTPCNVTQPDFTDTCFRSAADNANAGTTISNGVENFGMQIVCVSNSSSQSGNTPESSGDLSTTSNLGAGGNGTGASNTFRTAYANGDTTLGQITDAAADNCEDTEAGNLYAWQDSATAQTLIGSNTVVDDELIKLRFGASANATTPTGTYTVASTFIATPTF